MFCWCEFALHVIKTGPINTHVPEKLFSERVSYKRRINKFVGSNLFYAHPKFPWINYIDTFHTGLTSYSFSKDTLTKSQY